MTRLAQAPKRVTTSVDEGDIRWVRLVFDADKTGNGPLPALEVWQDGRPIAGWWDPDSRTAFRQADLGHVDGLVWIGLPDAGRTFSWRTVDGDTGTFILPLPRERRLAAWFLALNPFLVAFALIACPWLLCGAVKGLEGTENAKTYARLAKGSGRD